MTRKKLVRIYWIVCFSLFLGGMNAQEDIVEGFFDEIVQTGYSLPVGIEFDENGNGFLWEKSGKLYLLDNTLESRLLLLDLSEEVASWGDNGLTGFALDPDFLFNGKIYLGYTVDRYYLFNYGTPNYNPDSTILTNATIGRVTKYELDNNSFPYRVKNDSREILIGTDKNDGFPILADFHGVGSLSFGNDGSLLVGCGDGGLDSDPNVTFHSAQALKDGIIDSTEFLGSYRAQSIHSMNGKIMRVNPLNGNGLPGNPFFEIDNPRSAKSRMWALGLRNPYKFIHIPETGGHNMDLGDPGIIISGDVGSSYWEEFNVIREGGQNFGWPVYEGHHQVWPYGWDEVENPFAPNPLSGQGDCNRKNFIFQNLLMPDNQERRIQLTNPCGNGTLPIPEDIPTFIHTRPIIYYNNTLWNPPTRTFIPGYDSNGVATERQIDSTNVEISKLFEGFSAMPGAWYDTGSLPEEYHHSLIVSDFSGWIKTFKFDESFEELKEVHNISENISGIVDVALHPIDDCIYYIHILEGSLHKICFGGNPAPVAIAEADTLYGGPELEIHFDASSSYDPNNLPISVHWDFGDGSESSEWEVNHTFKVNDGFPKLYLVSLTVTDSLGAVGTDTLKVSLNNTPPTAKIVSPVPSSLFSINGYNRIDLDAEVKDQEENLDQLKYTWQVHLHHNLHYHSEEAVHKERFSTLIEPVGCVSIDTFWYRISLDVEDSYGLSARDEILIFPNCNEYPEVQWLRSGYNGGVELNWEFSNNELIEYIIVQKLEPSGSITDIGSTQFQSNNTYQFLDENPVIGENRYRLKVFDTGGNYFYSKEKVSLYPVTSPLTLFPNPTSEQGFTLRVDQPYGDPLDISIFDITGKLIHHVYHETSPNLEWKKFIYLESLSSGMYIIQVENGDRVFREKLEVVR